MFVSISNLGSRWKSNSRKNNTLHQNPWSLFTLTFVDLLGLEVYKGNITSCWLLMTIQGWLGYTSSKKNQRHLKSFKAFKAYVENERDLNIKCLRSDNGGEFTSKEFNMICEDHGIKRQFSAPRTPQHNGVVERKNIIVQEVARTMLNEAKLLDKFWRDAVYTWSGFYKNNEMNTDY